MRVNLVRCFAILLGVVVASPGWADFGQDATGSYVAPSKWSRFNTGAPVQPSTARSKQTLVRPVSSGGALVDPPAEDALELPAPSTSAPSTPIPSMRRPSTPTPEYSLPSASSIPQPEPSAFSSALSAPWTDCDPAPQTYACAPARAPLSPWFAGGNVLFWDMANDRYQRFAAQTGSPTTTILSTDNVAPESTIGYDVFVGRYFDCGRYGLSVNYLNFDPDMQETIAPGDHYATMPSWRDISIDRDGAGPDPVQTVYDIFDAAAARRVRRDVSIQGLELNLSCFGIMGAQRLSSACGTGCAPGCDTRFGARTLAGIRNALGFGRGVGYSGAGGPLARSCDGAAQVITTHGFRWFQFEDEFEFASTDAADGYVGPTDMFYDSNVTNDLYGYQFGSRLVYCLGPRLVANIGGKAGIYGNDVYVEQRIGTPTDLAYVTTDPTQQIASSDRDVVLAGLGELDLGLGYRLSNAWTINGGYRMLYATGVATSIGSIANEYHALAPSARVAADGSLLLHGAYVGAALNW